MINSVYSILKELNPDKERFQIDCFANPYYASYSLRILDKKLNLVQSSQISVSNIDFIENPPKFISSLLSRMNILKEYMGLSPIEKLAVFLEESGYGK